MPKKFLVEPFSVSLITGTEKVWIRGGEHQDFPSKIFCLTVPKVFVGQSFTVAIISGIEKVWIRRGGGASRFSVENFLSHRDEKFRRAILHCCNNFGYRKSLNKKGGHQDFPSKIFLSHSAERFRRGTLLCRVSEKFRKRKIYG